MDILIRWLAAFLLLAATYNPTDFNYIRWALGNHEAQLSVVVLLGLLLSVGYIIFLRATLRSIGLFGMILITAIFAALIWVLYDLGLLRLENPGVQTWLGILALSIVLGVGLSWSIVRRRLSGQADVDDVDA
ncbi:DUF6524 family protein [Dinoroseobacter sp. S124A]|uniref:DUF6524 family protein n=1 Tax=Dinoroseobacter sp. S124A TaxID=3415128 RepID=UPI003C7DEBBA